ncbi:MAG: sulfurtransferase TusA family protein [Dehalococcoidales bacterium]|jgi:TusA-related sulfurtransferase|nr:sulfurtransferase TusA family protein [Dehalococcoidales bacterium]MDP7525206.1 sulfurtransferase TusA family protein [Dehalococcoidales bacterium]
MKADQSIDCIGLYCPLPIVKTAEKIKQMKTGEVLEVVADDKGIKLDMPAWCDSTGHECLGMEDEDTGGEIKLYVKKAHD